jgi:hypothetical protein
VAKSHKLTFATDHVNTALNGRGMWTYIVVVVVDIVAVAEGSGARRMHELLTCFDMIQCVKGPTHNRGNSLDLVITPSS